jgi:hypothetical protein
LFWRWLWVRTRHEACLSILDHLRQRGVPCTWWLTHSDIQIPLWSSLHPRETDWRLSHPQPKAEDRHPKLHESRSLRRHRVCQGRRLLLQHFSRDRIFTTLSIVLFIDNKSAISLAQAFSGNHKPSDVLTKAKPRPGHEKNTLELLGPQHPGSDTRLEAVHSLTPDVQNIS